jgi:hypothetical protein
MGLNAGDNTTGVNGTSAISIGTDSNSVATQDIGTDSIAIGRGASVVALRGISIGNNVVSTATSSTIAIGESITLTGSNSIAIGEGVISASSAIAIGQSADAGATGSIAMGRISDVDPGAEQAIAIGDNAIVSGGTADSSIAVGHDALTSALGAIAVGRQMNATGTGAILFGHHTAALTNARTNSFAVGWDETIPSIWIEKYTATTSGVGGTATIDIPLDASSTYTLEIMVTGGETDATPTMFASRTFDALYQRIGSGSAVEEGEDAGTLLLSSAATTENVNITIAPSGNNVRISITGPDTTSTAMNWRALVKLTKVVSN